MDVWPLRPNWREPIRITHGFKTEVISSRRGFEQRRAQRQTARKTVEFLVGPVDGSRFRALTRAMLMNQGPLIAWADQTRATRSTSYLGGGAYVVGVASTPDWAVAGAKVILAVGDTQALRTVQAVNPGVSLTFVETGGEWPAKTKVCPAFTGRVASEIGGTQYLPAVVETPIRFDVDPGSEQKRYLGDIPATWNGREVILNRANWRDPRELGFRAEMQSVDYGVGRTVTYMPRAFGEGTRSADYMFRSKAEADTLLKFFERHKGQRGEFYAPSDQPDIVLSSAGAFGANFITAQGPDIRAFASDPVYAAISVRMKDGQRFYRKVGTMAADGPHSRINLVGTLPYEITPTTVEVISWLPILRHASDEATFEWLTDEAGQVRFTYRTLPDAPSE